MGFYRGPNIVTDGLVLYLDAANTRSYPGTDNTWTDLSGNGNHGTLNGPTFNSENNGSIVFNNSKHVVSGNVTYGNSFTLSVWFKPNNNTIQSGLGSTIFASSPNTQGYPIWVMVNGLKLVVYCYSVNTSTFQRTDKSFIDNTWNNITVTATISSTSNIYLNGVLDSTFTAGSVAAQTVFTIGDLRPDRGIGYKGSVGISKLYNRSLTTSEVLQNYNATKSRYGL
jgi:hypothetical protein